MKKILLLGLIFLIIVGVQVKFLSEFKFNISVISDIVTFLSILFGFYITSLAIFVTSQYVSNLYKVIDKNNKTQTLLHALTSNYKLGLLLTLASLIYFIFIQFFINFPVDGLISLGNIMLYPVLAFLVIDFLYCFLMLKDLIEIIVQEGKDRSKNI
jgi:hypothetical protein